MPDIKILVIDDDASIRDACTQLLKRAGYSVRTVGTGTKGIEAFKQHSFDLVLLDLNLPDMSGMDVLAQLRENRHDCDVVMITGYASIESAVSAMKAGAFDYVAKPFQGEELLIVIKKALKKHSMEMENIYLRQALNAAAGKGRLIWASEAFGRVVELIDVAASSDSTTLITGDSGTGKEVVAREIHKRSSRSSGPFVTVDCGTLVESLFESELFGHVKGAFTGAFQTKIGRLQLANNGTIFLDEISNLNMHLQAKLLRVVQEREVVKVGDTRVVKVDVRIIAATNVDLVRMVSNGEFREDLYYRLNVIPIQIPGLAQRRADIMPLARYFLGKFSRKLRKDIRDFDSKAIKMLTAYGWPGNVRELENLVERAVVLAKGEQIGEGELVFCGIPKADGAIDFDRQVSLKEMESVYVDNILKQCEGNVSQAARILGIDRKTLRSKLNRSPDDKDS